TETEFGQYREEIITLMLAGKKEEALALLRGNAYAPAKAEEASMIKMIEMKVADAKTTSDDNTALASQSTLVMVAIIVVGVLIAVVIGIVLSYSITKPMSQGVTMMQAMTQGDLSTRLKMTRKDEIGILSRSMDELADSTDGMAIMAQKIAAGDFSVAFEMRSEKDVLGRSFTHMLTSLKQVVIDIVNISEKLADGDLTATPQAEYGGEFAKVKIALMAALDGLNSTMRQTNAVVEQVAQSVEQVRSISQDLASNAEEQSSAAEEVTSNLEETNTQVKANSENAEVSNQLASETGTVADLGQAKMKTMSEAMGAIADSSREIAKIIKVIDEIAFQTNLLALNAAVEAARAGQHGRGFAVVAQEVRNLAGRSAKAAKETAELIDDAGRRVADGVKVAGETSTALNEIVQNVTKVKDLAGEIASASEEQSKGLAQINVAMLQVNQGAQASSQQSEELASTADELGNLADRLREEAARFKLQEQKGFTDGMGGLLPAGITPEIMRQIVEMGRQQNAAGAQPNKTAVPQPVVHKENGKKVALPLPMDRDKRGYGQF
ncbi:MAG: HAMP domain-containing protein, partial [Anaerolineales bacterium]|nr:HAMP domain-containing protein [Anaerolineales bacterium]